jgi:hypothetical protein
MFFYKEILRASMKSQILTDTVDPCLATYEIPLYSPPLIYCMPRTPSVKIKISALGKKETS